MLRRKSVWSLGSRFNALRVITPLVLGDIGFFLFCSTYGASAATYVWTGSMNADYQDARNWSPNRSSPSSSDILQFNAGGTVSVINVNTETIAELHVTANTALVLSALSAVKTLTIQGGSADPDLEIASGCSLTLTGNYQVTISLGAGATGAVSGDLVFNCTASSGGHRILVNAANGLVFNSGATCAMAPSSSGAGSGFGNDTPPTSVEGSVHFRSGSTFYQNGFKDGTRSATTGSNPFGLTAPAAIAVFEPGSTFVLWQGTPALSGRTYANYISRLSADPIAPSAFSLTFTVLNDFVVRSSGVLGQGRFPMPGQGTTAMSVGGSFVVETGSGGFQDTTAASSASVIEVQGNVDIQNASLFDPGTNAYRAWLLDGPAAQSVNFAGKTLPNLTFNNAAGITLTGSVNVTALLNLQAGEVGTGVYTLATLTEGLTGIVRTSGFVRGTLTRTFNAANMVAGDRLFPIGTAGEYSPVKVNLTGAGTGSGTLAVSVAAQDHPNAARPLGTIDRYWTLTPAGFDLSAGSATLVFTYPPADLTGSVLESSMIAGRRTGGTWQLYPGTTVISPSAHTATITGVNGFSEWSLGNSDAFLPVGLALFRLD